MACNCADHDPNDPTHRPCAPCLAARMLPPKMVPAVMSGTPVSRAASIRLGAASDDVQTLQRFLQQLSSTQTFPTNAELDAAQQAATNLSAEVPGMPGAPSPSSGSGSPMTVSPAGVILMVAGAALIGGGAVYIAATSRRRRRR